MKKYLFIVLLVGVWSCEDESVTNDNIHPLIGEWKFIQETFTVTPYLPSPDDACPGDSSIFILTNVDYVDTLIFNNDNTLQISGGYVNQVF
ncbi:MAG: hypothetical protein CBD77_01700 [bacterium TMED217]|nr:MAG: hypothetical protein CBD77_01700 [bacterium TMED217]|tara:strand:- start:1068 stop:1340 length:273 start_codon:yes stop_codon:yes gene_type:complete